MHDLTCSLSVEPRRGEHEIRAENETGRTSELLLNIETPSVRLELRRNVFRHEGGESYWLNQPILEMALDGRPATGEIYFEGRSGNIGGSVGGMVYLPPAVPIDARWQAGVEMSLCCHFSSAAAARFPDLSDSEMASALSLSSPRMRNIMMDMREELERRDFHYGTVVEGFGLQLAGLLARHLEIATHSARGLRPDRLPHAQFEEMLTSLHGRRGTPTMRVLAEELGYSEGHFGRLFQAAVGRKFSDYVIGKKMAWAEEMLRSTGTPIKEIAFELGYEVSADFSRAFRRYVGMSPREYRNGRRHDQ